MRRSTAPGHAWTMMLVTGALLLPLASVAPAASAANTDAAPARPASPVAPTARQQDFAAAARAYGVPAQVLLGVSYLESRWDANAGQPSTAAGYGPMHLTDVRGAVAGGAVAIGGRGDGTGDARGTIGYG